MIDITPDPVAFTIGSLPDPLVRHLLRRRAGRRLPRPRPRGAAPRPGPRDRRQRPDHRRDRRAHRRPALPRHRPVGGLRGRPDQGDPAGRPPARRLVRVLGLHRARRAGGIITGTIAAWFLTRRWKRSRSGAGPTSSRRRCSSCRRSAARQLLQPGAVRPADDAAVGDRDRLRPPGRRVPLRRRSRWRRPTSTRCSCTSRCPGCSARSSCSGSAAPRDAAASRATCSGIFFIWYGVDALRPRVPARRTTGRSSASRPPRSCRSAFIVVRRRPVIWYRHGPGRPTEPAVDSASATAGARRVDDGPRRPTARGPDRRPTPTTAARRRDPGRDDRPARRADRPELAGRGRRIDPATGAGRRPAGSRPRRSPPPAAARSRASTGSVARRSRGRRRHVPVRSGCSPGSSSSAAFRFRIATSGQEHLPRGRLPARRGGPPRLDGPVRRPPRAPARSRGPGSSAAGRRRSPRAGASGSSAGSAACCRSGAAASAIDAARRVGPGRRSPTAASSPRCRRGPVSGPPGRIGPFRTGWALIALRTDAPIVPLAMAGTEELYLGQRMASRVLPARRSRDLLGPGWDGAAPGRGHARGARPRPPDDGGAGRPPRPGRRGAPPSTVDPPDRPRRLRRRLTWLLLRPGRLDRE